jgi:hypothetical protein
MTLSHAVPLPLPEQVEQVLAHARSLTVARCVDDLVKLSVRDAGADGWHEVGYDVPGRGSVLEARVCRVRNGVAANYIEPYMRRRDPDCMVIADDQPTNKPRYREWFGSDFADLRQQTLAWLRQQDLAAFFFFAGTRSQEIPALAICPANAGFFALGLALLQGIVDPAQIPADARLRAVIYVAPPFRHTHFKGKQIVVHNRQDDLHEMFSYNLYPGPSAKKGIYGVLLNVGEQEDWITMHCSTAQVVTPYDNRLTLSHEGASGGGKSEMLEHVHRERDGRLLLGRNMVNQEERFLVLPGACSLRPVTDDMALCPPTLQKGNGTLTVCDAEQAWFVRVNHINRYGVDPHLEELTVAPPQPLLFLNIQAHPGSTALIWEHIEDEPGKPCPNPRVIVPRAIVPGIVNGPVTVDVRSFGVRTPPCTAQQPTYGILGLLHLLPPSLAWLWRLVAPRGHANPSIVATEGMTSEGVGSYWPFATGRRVDQANLLLRQIMDTPRVRYVLIPNQHVGAWHVSFMPQWLAREYVARRGGAKFTPQQVKPARCPLLGFALRSMMIEGQSIPPMFLQVERQPEVGEPAYDAGAAILREFFVKQLADFQDPDLMPQGRRIIQCCLDGGTLQDYLAILDLPVLEEET